MKPGASLTPKVFSPRLSKNRMLKPFAAPPVLELIDKPKQRQVKISQGDKTLEEPTENTPKASGRSVQTRVLNLRSSKSTKPTMPPFEGKKIIAPVDHYFMDSYVLTSSALYGSSSDEDEEPQVLRREESVEIKGTVAVSSTGGKESVSDVEISRKPSSSIKLLQKQMGPRNSEIEESV